MLETLWSQRDSNVFKIAVLTAAEQRWRKTSHFIIYESSILHTKKFMDSAKNCNNLRLFVSTFFVLPAEIWKYCRLFNNFSKWNCNKTHKGLIVESYFCGWEDTKNIYFDWVNKILFWCSFSKQANLVMMQLTWSWLAGETFSICCNSDQSNKAIKYQYVQNFLNRKRESEKCFRFLKWSIILVVSIRFRHWWIQNISSQKMKVARRFKKECYLEYFMCLQIFSNFTFYILSKANMGIRFRFQ